MGKQQNHTRPAAKGNSKSEFSDDDDDKPLSARLPAGLAKRDGSSSVQKPTTSDSDDSDDEKPLSLRLLQKTSNDRPVSKSLSLSNKRPSSEVNPADQSSVKKPRISATLKDEDDDDDDYEDDDVPLSQRIKTQQSSVKKPAPSCLHETNKDSKKVKKNKSGKRKKWTTLVHNGVIFPDPYKPHGIKMLYDNQPVSLTPEQEEVATMFAVLKESEYVKKPLFRKNFFSDWKKLLGQNHTIQNLDGCDFTPIYQWHQAEREKMKQISREEKKALKAEKDRLEEKYQWAFVDGVKEKVGNFRVEPPGLFRGRGEHPKMGKLKKRIRPSDIIINIGEDAPVPTCPNPGETWKKVRHSDKVEWLACWPDPINGREFKYVSLAASSLLKGKSDKSKYEKARLLKDHIQRIRSSYTMDFADNKDSTQKQIAVATYLIDKLALRAGNEKDDDEADTVGCCTLKVENVELAPPSTLKLDFLGKDSVRYQNEVKVEHAVFRAIKQFRKGKKGSDDLFDKLDTSRLNAHLKQLMDGLTAKVFRTYNASITLDTTLAKETRNGGDVAEKVAVYNRANKEVAIICNHQRAVPKAHGAQMTRLGEKIDELKAAMEELKNGAGKGKITPEKKMAQANARIEKLERDKLTKEDLKTVALGTSKINYLDPRITVAWCKRHEVPIEKIFNKSLLEKFSWAMDVDPSFIF